MVDLAAARSRDPQFPRVLLVHQSSEEEGERVLAKLWPEVEAIADPDQELYEAMRIPRLSWGKLFRWSSFLHTLRAVRRGFGIGRPRGGDPRRAPGIFLVEKGEVQWEHPFESGVGDHPDWAAIARS